MDITPFDAPFGAEVSDIDLSLEISSDDAVRLNAALEQYLVLRVRRQRISDPDLIRFAGLFGELDPPGPNPYGAPMLPEYPELNVISNVVVDGKPIGNLGYGEAVWHADLTYVDTPPRASVLYGIEIPVGAGDTYFADMFAAYAALPDDLKQRIDGRVAIHDASHNSAGMRRRGYDDVTDVRETPGSRHPLVRTRPSDGRKCLFLGRRPRGYIVGMEVAKSEELLDTLWTHATQDRFTWKQQWYEGDMVMWNNLAVLHKRDAFDNSLRRVLHRAQIKGTERIA